MKNNSRKYLTNYLIVALLIWGASYLTICANYPRIYSPYSFTIVMPLFFFYSFFDGTPITFFLSTLIGPIFYALWCFPLIKGQSKIPKRTVIMTPILVTASFALLFTSWNYGAEYQGKAHTILMYIFNASFWILLFSIFRMNKKRESYLTNLVFNWVLFTWFFWVGFPWLGELL